MAEELKLPAKLEDRVGDYYVRCTRESTPEIARWVGRAWRFPQGAIVYQWGAVEVLARIPNREELGELREKAGIATLPVDKIHELLHALSNTVNVEPKYASAAFEDSFDEFLEMLCAAKPVFWVCPKGCRGYVEHHPFRRCVECGYAEGIATKGPDQ